jgi:tRNA(His) 5'-end guanylyltransferase
MQESLSDRQKLYEQSYDYKIIKRLPLIIRCDGRSFHRVTKQLPRPYSPEMLNLMANTMLHAAMEIEGAVFAYHQSDEITFVVRNDQSLESEPWFQNRIQKIASIVASIITLAFTKNLFTMDDAPKISGDATFDARVFAVPSITEAANNLIFRQQDCSKNAITGAAQAELSKIYGKKHALSMLHEKKSAEKIELLRTKCDIDYETFYPNSFRLGTAAYKVPTILRTEDGETTRNKWIIDMNIPNFVSDRNFLLNILHAGHDVFRADRDLIIKE